MKKLIDMAKAVADKLGVNRACITAEYAGFQTAKPSAFTFYIGAKGVTLWVDAFHFYVARAFPRRCMLETARPCDTRDEVLKAVRELTEEKAVA